MDSPRLNDVGSTRRKPTPVNLCSLLPPCDADSSFPQTDVGRVASARYDVQVNNQVGR